MQSSTDEQIRKRLQDQVRKPLEKAREGFLDGFLPALGDALRGNPPEGYSPIAAGFRDGLSSSLDELVFAPLAEAFTGSPGELPEITSAIADQQSKTQKLIDERGRGCTYSSRNIAYRGRGTHSERERIPFTEQIGPLIGAAIDPAGGVVIRTPGSWQIIAKTGVSGTSAPGGNWQRMWIEVFRADGSLLAESWSTEVIGSDQGTNIDVLPLVVSPEDAAEGVTVRVYQDAGRHRWLLGGHGYTLLLVQKQSRSREMSTVDPGHPGDWTEE
ncbi:hypothetical protein KRX51_03255 [Corynebacterium sp. TAE3-ERU12]|uniref:hypothetical protein n=1 Tax=Corynebacterium sp. TAE3-ERU12 TaxID=2849491 RepID=UPI001C43B335|nr:hypothetical protein [Corynebacterium sp. TAE3-ERU12]MBV7294936.1 hypothetical protein [Corynebacterium sp. TAE3-ERU12]